MDFYEAVYRRQSIRDFAEKDVPADTVNRILQAGLKAPTNNHLREWEFVVLRSRQSIEAVLGQVGEKAQQQMQALASRRLDDCQRSMYLDAVPKQYHMLSQSGCLILPFYKQNGDLLRPSALQSLNGFAAVWCCIENILLAAAAEGLDVQSGFPREKNGSLQPARSVRRKATLCHVILRWVILLMTLPCQSRSRLIR